MSMALQRALLRAWQGAYPGILPASTLQAFMVDSRRKYWSGVRLDGRGVGNVYQWVLTANERTRRFYENLGGRRLADRLRDADFDGVGGPEVPYVWPRLPILTTDGRMG
jgi:hypothetical protein